MVEEEFDSPPSSIWLFAISVALAAYALLRVFANSLELVFPQMPSGTYIGSITGLATGPVSGLSNEQATLYVESKDDGRSLVISVFLEGVATKKIRLRERTVGEGGAGGANIEAFHPARFVINKVEYMLYGSHSRAVWKGGVIASDGGAGKWSLERLPNDALPVPEVPNFELRKWMFVASQNKLLEEEFSSISKEINTANSLRDDLKKAETNAEVLQHRIEGKIPELNKQLQSIQEGNAQMTKEVEERVKELDLLSRLSKRGKVVLLSRRILNRERGWYFANWPSEFAGDSSAHSNVDSSQEDSSEIDLEELEARFEKAQQVASIYDKVQREKLEIKRLERMLNDEAERRNLEQGERAEDYKDRKEEEDTGSFWDRLFR